MILLNYDEIRMIDDRCFLLCVAHRIKFKSAQYLLGNVTAPVVRMFQTISLGSLLHNLEAMYLFWSWFCSVAKIMGFQRTLILKD